MLFTVEILTAISLICGNPSGQRLSVPDVLECRKEAVQCSKKAVKEKRIEDIGQCVYDAGNKMMEKYK